jgi:hypothetical protein
MTAFFYASALLIGYGVLAIFTLVGLMILVGAVDEIFVTSSTSLARRSTKFDFDASCDTLAE